MSKETGNSGNNKKKKSSGGLTVFLVAIILIGVGIVLYPTVSDWWNSMHATQAISSYVESVDKLDDTEKDKLIEEAKAYNKRLKRGVHLELNDEDFSEYEKILDISGTGIMGYISIPKINVNLPIYHTTEEAVLQIAVGHVEGSSLPVGGDGTHAVLSGHRGLPSAKLFTDLDEMQLGDVFTITVLNDVLTYQVDQIKVVLPEEITDLSIVNNHDYVTLVTCTPYGINSHRMLVRGNRIETPEEYIPVVVNAEASKIPFYKVVGVIGIPLLLLSLIVTFIFSSIKPKKNLNKIMDEFRR